MASADISSAWSSAFPDRHRPQLYSNQPYNEDGFEVLTSSQEFLADTSILDGQQMYILATNNQTALQTAQEEYMALERQLNQLKHKDVLTRPIIKDPRKLPDRDVYEEMKEANLYNYKYDPKRALPPTAIGIPVAHIKDVSEIEKHDMRMAQDPWTQGGFVPGKRQADTIRAKARNPQNPDAWAPIEKNGRHLIPKMYSDSEANFNERYGRYGAPALKHQPQPVLLASTRRAAADGSANGTRTGTPNPVNKPLRNTRFNGAKVPQTRDVSEAPSVVVSRASTPKRKRGDTPLYSIENGSPAAKKAKTVVGVATTALTAAGHPRKRHNQYTKAKERAEQEAAAAALAIENGAPPPEPEASPRPAPPPKPTKSSKGESSELDANGIPLWRSLTRAEKYEYTSWAVEDLVTAIAEDPSWTSGPFDFHDPNLPDKIQQKLKNIQTKVHRAQNPVRSWAAYRTWLSWTFDGNDKRGPRRGKGKGKGDGSEEPELEGELSEGGGEVKDPDLVDLVDGEVEEDVAISGGNGGGE